MHNYLRFFCQQLLSRYGFQASTCRACSSVKAFVIPVYTIYPLYNTHVVRMYPHQYKIIAIHTYGVLPTLSLPITRWNWDIMIAGGRAADPRALTHQSKRISQPVLGCHMPRAFSAIDSLNWRIRLPFTGSVSLFMFLWWCYLRKA